MVKKNCLKYMHGKTISNVWPLAVKYEKIVKSKTVKTNNVANKRHDLFID